VSIFADGDNCQFTFQDGNTILVTETRVYRTFGVEQVSVFALGAGGVASFYDLPSNDTFTLQSNHVLFEGGGYHIETLNFQKADVYSISGGNDATMIYGENNSRTIVANNLVQRLDATTSYRVWNTKTVIATNLDETNNVLTFMNMTPGEEYYVALGCISVVNAQQTVSWQAFGFNTVAINQFASGTSTITVYLEEGSSITSLDGQTVFTDGIRKVVLPVNATYTIRPDSSPPSTFLPPVSMSSVAAVDSLLSLPEELFDPDNNLASGAVLGTSVATHPNESGYDGLLRALAWEHLRKDNTANDITLDDEINLLRGFARRIALMQKQ
jgi:hypothetical protein